MFVPTRTDSTKYSAVDGKFPTFGTSVEVSKAGFGVMRPDGTFEILDALPLGRAEAQIAVEAGSAKTAASTNASAGFVAVDFATADYLDETEVDAGRQFGLDSDLITTNLT